MKRLSVCTSLLTFVAGLVISWGADQIQLTAYATQAHNAQRAPSNLSGRLELEFIRLISNQYHTYAQLRITNGSSETVRFPGYAKNSNALLFIRHGILINPVPDTQSLNAFGTQSLLPGDTAIFDAQIPDDEQPFEVGFAYEVGKHLWKIVWSGKIEPTVK